MRFIAAAALALALTACGASAPPPAPTPPSPAIVALAKPPAGLAPAPSEAQTRVIDHKLWSITVPSTWTVTEDTEEGVTVEREKAPGVLPARLQVISQPLDDTEPTQFCAVMSMMATAQLPEGVTATHVARQLGHWHGHTSSVTQVNTDAHVFLGVLATVDEAHKTGYVVLAIAPMNPDDGHLMGAMSQTFTLKTAAPPEAEVAPAPPPPAPKATPKKK